MTAPVGPLLRAPEEWAFGIEDLADFGVTFAPEQLELYERAQHEQVAALMVGFPHNPEVHFGVMPLFTMDEFDTQQIVTVPAVITLSPAYLDTVLAREGALHYRFPSLPGRRLDPSYNAEWGFDVALMMPESNRLWNLWPISEHEVTDVLDAVRLWREGSYELLEAFYACEIGDMDACDIVTVNEGIPYDQHQHRFHTDSRGDVQIIECIDGEEWLDTFKRHCFRLDPDGLMVPLPMPDLRLVDENLQRKWEHLRDTSAINTYRTITAIPERDRETVLQTERNYSPWLWSY